MAFSLDVKSLLVAGSLSIVSLVAVQESVQAEPVVSSYYGGELAGNPTASGEPFNPRELTAAHPSLPLGTVLTVSYNGRSVNVRVNDRGPHVAGRGLDISLAAAQTLGLAGSGTGVVDIKPAGAPEAKPPVPKSETTEQARPARAVSTPEAAASDEAHGQEENPKFLSEDMLTPPGKRITGSMSEVLPPRPHTVDAHHEKILLEPPPATESPEVREDQISETLPPSPAALERRKGEPGKRVV